MRRYTFLALAGLLLLVLVAAPAAAQPPKAAGKASFGVTFSGPVNLGSQQGTFSASGEAVDHGLVCPSGTTSAVEWQGRAEPGGGIVTTKAFTCDDGSGTFYVTLNVSILWNGDTSFSWQTTPGRFGPTGDYQFLRGSGSGGGVWDGGGSTFDTYIGTVRVAPAAYLRSGPAG